MSAAAASAFAVSMKADARADGRRQDYPHDDVIREGHGNPPPPQRPCQWQWPSTRRWGKWHRHGSRQLGRQAGGYTEEVALPRPAPPDVASPLRNRGGLRRASIKASVPRAGQAVQRHYAEDAKRGAGGRKINYSLTDVQAGREDRGGLGKVSPAKASPPLRSCRKKNRKPEVVTVAAARTCFPQAGLSSRRARGRRGNGWRTRGLALSGSGGQVKKRGRDTHTHTRARTGTHTQGRGEPHKKGQDILLPPRPRGGRKRGRCSFLPAAFVIRSFFPGRPHRTAQGPKLEQRA